MSIQTEQGLSDSFQKIGSLLSEHISLGIAAGSDEARAAMEQVNGELLESQKRYLAEKEKMSLEAETELKNKLTRLQAESAKEYADALQVHADTLKTAIKVQKSAIINDFDEIAKRAVSSLDEIEKATQKMEQKMVSFGGLYETKRQVFLNTGPGGSKEVFEKTILDLTDERQELERYATLLQKVRSMSEIPAELFSAIRDLPISDAIAYQEALLALSEGDRAAYLADWQAIQKLSAETAKSSYAEETRQVLSTIEGELESWYGTIPAGFLRQGELSAEQFGAGFINKLSDLQNALAGAVTSLLASPAETTKANTYTAGSNIQNTQHNTYVLKESGETIAQQLQVIAAAETVKRLRGDT